MVLQMSNIVARDFRVAIVPESDFPQMISLRKSAYARAFSDAVDLRFLGRGRWDDLHFNLAVYHKDQILSVVRLAVINCVEDFQFIMAADFDSSQWNFPVAIMHRAATHEDYLGHGLHSLLRIQAIEICQKLNIGWLFSALQEDSGRLKQLTEAGYELLEMKKNWTGFLRNKSIPIVAVLDVKEHFARAQTRLALGRERFYSEIAVTELMKAFQARYANVVQIEVGR